MKIEAGGGGASAIPFLLPSKRVQIEMLRTGRGQISQMQRNGGAPTRRIPIRVMIRPRRLVLLAFPWAFGRRAEELWFSQRKD